MAKVHFNWALWSEIVLFCGTIRPISELLFLKARKYLSGGKFYPAIVVLYYWSHSTLDTKVKRDCTLQNVKLTSGEPLCDTNFSHMIFISLKLIKSRSVFKFFWNFTFLPVPAKYFRTNLHHAGSLVATECKIGMHDIQLQNQKVYRVVYFFKFFVLHQLN